MVSIFVSIVSSRRCADSIVRWEVLDLPEPVMAEILDCCLLVVVRVPIVVSDGCG